MNLLHIYLTGAPVTFIFIFAMQLAEIWETNPRTVKMLFASTVCALVWPVIFLIFLVGCIAELFNPERGQ